MDVNVEKQMDRIAKTHSNDSSLSRAADVAHGNAERPNKLNRVSSPFPPDLQIDNEFRALIPPLTAEEYAGLEADIVANGCRMPLDVWGDIIVDGHNRYEICTKHDLPFKANDIAFADRREARIWIRQNQLNRRNISPYQRSVIVLSLEGEFKAEARERQKGGQGGILLPQKSWEAKPADRHDRETVGQLARQAGVSHDTISKVKFIEQHGSEDIKAKCAAGERTINRAVREIKTTQAATRRTEQRRAAAKTVAVQDERIIIGDFRDRAAMIPDNSLSLIFTDPPYDRQAQKLFPDLGAFAAAKLIEGGSLLCYVGQTQIPAARKSVV